VRFADPLLPARRIWQPRARRGGGGVALCAHERALGLTDAALILSDSRRRGGPRRLLRLPTDAVREPAPELLTRPRRPRDLGLRGDVGGRRQVRLIPLRHLHEVHAHGEGQDQEGAQDQPQRRGAGGGSKEARRRTWLPEEGKEGRRRRAAARVSLAKA
jgi:hypothetical protein